MSEIQKIKNRQLERLYSKCNRKEGDISYLDMLVPAEDIPGAYRFPDVDYSDRSMRAQWPAAVHYSRIEREAILAAKENRLNREECINKILGALEYWLEMNLISSNWWYNQIGVPKSLVNTALVIDDYLTGQMREKLEKIILRGSFKAHCMLGIESFDNHQNIREFNSTPDRWRATNLMWGATTSINHAIWTEDEELMRISVDLIGKELCYSESGIMPDGAFVQHGRRWYSGGYGRAFVCEMTPLINLLGGTSFAIPEEKIKILLSHVLDGQRHMHRNGYFDFGAIEREFSRRSCVGFGSALTDSIKMLSETEGIQRADELREFYTAVSGGADEFESTVYYDSIAQLCHKKNGVYIGVRGRTKNVLGSEECNKEGVLGYNMSYGTVTCVMESGREYYDISGVWDFSKIPGTTARSETDEQLLTHGDWSYDMESECKTKGLVDGDVAILSERAVHDGISLNATFFVFDGAMVSLGSDIKDDRGELLHTTVEQCFADEEPVIGKNLVKRGRITYKNLASTNDFSASYEQRIGSWHRNCTPYKDESVSGKLLTVTIPVSTGETYAYTAYIGKEPDVLILKNDAECQAILVGGKTFMAVFHMDTSIAFNGNTIFGKTGELAIKKFD